MKDELRGKIITESDTIRPKTYSYLTDDDKNGKKAKGKRKCVIKRILKFNHYKNCLFKNEIILKSQQRLKSEGHCVYTEDVIKIALSSNNDKRLQTFDGITAYSYGKNASYPYGTNAFKVCNIEMLSKYK